MSETVRRPNLAPFLDDPDCWLVASIEDYDEDTDTAKQGPIFTQRVIHPPVEPVISSAADALAVTLHEVGHVDPDRIAELLGRPRAEVLAELGDAVFLNPALTTEAMEVWETADAYLSGPVRTKLAAAEAVAVTEARYGRNVPALRAVQPEDLKPSDITARLGAPWMPADVVEAFVAEQMGVTVQIRHTVEIACWSFNIHAFAGIAAATSEWGTERRHAGHLLDDALNAVIPQIFDTWMEDGKERRELNAADTEAAKEKLAKIKTAFERWVWQDADRADRLSRIYNDRFNNLVPRTFDGSHLQLPGASSVIQMRGHQKRVIWRVISTGTTYIAHAVGAGKTFSMAAAIMEQRRLGLVTKAMMVVPGHCLAQASREFLLLYPNAQILVADETNFAREKRQRFLARAATGTWDCIIITHSAFKFIPAPAQFEKGLIDAQIQSYVDLLERVDSDDRITRKRLERLKERMEAKLEALAARKDDMLTIGEIGVDQLVVDEAQEFRKLSFATNMASLKGISPDGSQRAWDLYAKSRYIAQTQPARNLILASGTPITNTMGEMFSLQRFMQPDVLEERGLHEFDAWASTFGDTVTELELQPSGNYQPVTRFANFVNVADLIAMFRSVADVVSKTDLRGYAKLPDVRTGKRQILTSATSPAFKAYQKHPGQADRHHQAAQGQAREGAGHPALGHHRRPARGHRPAVRAAGVRERGGQQAEQPGQQRPPGLAGDAGSDLPQPVDRGGLPDPGCGADGVLGPGHGERRGDAGLLRLRVDPVRADPARRASLRDRLHAALQEVGRQAGPVQRREQRPGPHPARLDADHGHRGERAAAPGRPAPPGCAVAAQRHRAARGADRAAGQPERGDRHLRLRHARQRGRHQLAAAGAQGAVHRGRPGRRPLDPPLGGRRRHRQPVRHGQGSGLGRPAPDAEGGAGSRVGAHGAAAGGALRRPARHPPADRHGPQRHPAPRPGSARSSRTSRRGSRPGATPSSSPPARGCSTSGRRQAVRCSAASASPNGREQVGQWTLGTLGGFDVKMEGTSRFRGESYDLEVWIERTGMEQPVRLDGELTPLGLISRLEYALDHFEVELAEERRSLIEAEARLPGYERRVGESFGLHDELEAKAAELKALEADLAANDNRDADPDVEQAA